MKWVHILYAKKNYKELFEKNYLFPIFKKSDYYLIFTLNNVPIHKSKLVTNFLADHGIPVLQRPAQSLDLSLINNMWVVLKARKPRQKLTPKPKKDLIDQMSELWSNFETYFR